MLTMQWAMAALVIIITAFVLIAFGMIAKQKRHRHVPFRETWVIWLGWLAICLIEAYVGFVSRDFVGAVLVPTLVLLTMLAPVVTGVMPLWDTVEEESGG